MHNIKQVAKNSIAESLGIEPGDQLVTVDDKKIGDILDYQSFITKPRCSLEVKKPGGKVVRISVPTRSAGEFGLIFEDYLLDKPKLCRNKCIFCLADQLPNGLDPELYRRDDDYRVSALFGEYLTLSNVTYDDVERMRELGLQSINVSVHATEPQLRRRLLGNPNARDVLKFIQRLADAGLTMNAQIVLCRDSNDKEVLDNTIRDLATFHPEVQSISVVAAKITKYRKGLHFLQKFDTMSARRVVAQVQAHQQQYLKELGTRFVFLGDEFYHLSGVSYPKFSNYEEFPQMENGVGIVATFKNEYEDALAELTPVESVLSKTIAAGSILAPIFKDLTRDLGYDNIEVREIKNTLLGDDVTVAEMLSGRDIIDQLKEIEDVGEFLMIPCSMLFGAHGPEGRLIDGVSLSDIESALNTRILIFDEGDDFLHKLLY